MWAATAVDNVSAPRSAAVRTNNGPPVLASACTDGAMRPHGHVTRPNRPRDPRHVHAGADVLGEHGRER